MLWLYKSFKAVAYKLNWKLLFNLDSIDYSDWDAANKFTEINDELGKEADEEEKDENKEKEEEEKEKEKGILRRLFEKFKNWIHKVGKWERLQDTVIAELDLRVFSALENWLGSKIINLFIISAIEEGYA